MKRVSISSDREKLFDSLGPILERNRKAREAREQEIENSHSRPEASLNVYAERIDANLDGSNPETARRHIHTVFAIAVAWAAGLMIGLFFGG